ncbi:hypothetical protein [Streptomyces sp. URMC 129]|uniref:hypothetical protein n=1 Tax=Streptomyces sp. URMC 129 TaxID=3423407 RepID=UPI003F1DF1EF
MPDQIQWPKGTPFHLTVPAGEMGMCRTCKTLVHLPTHQCPQRPEPMETDE